MRLSFLFALPFLFLLSSCMKDQGYDNREDVAFLKEHAGREGVIVTNSGLQYRVLEEGEGASPDEFSQVRVHYKGSFVNGGVFDSSYDRGQPSDFPVSNLIAGFADGLMLMQPGAVYELVIPAKLGYGDRPPFGIHPGATLIFEVHLIGIL